jgi:hypothetical protein
MKDRKLGRKTTIVIALTGSMLTASIALAAWVATGTGTGAAKAGTAVSLTVANGTAAGDLYPGFTDGDLYFEVTNPNPYDVEVTAVEYAGGAITGAGGIGTCTTTGVTMDAGSIAIGPTTVAAGATVPFTVADVINMDNTSDNGCQDATFTIPVTVTGASL